MCLLSGLLLFSSQCILRHTIQDTSFENVNVCGQCFSPMQGLPGPPGEKGENGDVGAMVSVSPLQCFTFFHAQFKRC